MNGASSRRRQSDRGHDGCRVGFTGVGADRPHLDALSAPRGRVASSASSGLGVAADPVAPCDDLEIVGVPPLRPGPAPGLCRGRRRSPKTLAEIALIAGYSHSISSRRGQHPLAVARPSRRREVSVSFRGAGVAQALPFSARAISSPSATWTRATGPPTRRRRALRLHAARRRPDLQPHGDHPAGALRAARHRHRTRPRPGLPRPLLAAGRLSCSGSSARSPSSPATSPRSIGSAIALNLLFGIPLVDRRRHHGARRAAHPLPAEPGLPLGRGVRHRAARRHRRSASSSQIVARATGLARRRSPASRRRRRSSPTRRCSTSRSASSARR